MGRNKTLGLMLILCNILHTASWWVEGPVLHVTIREMLCPIYQNTILLKQNGRISTEINADKPTTSERSAHSKRRPSGPGAQRYGHPPH